MYVYVVAAACAARKHEKLNKHDLGAALCGSLGAVEKLIDLDRFNVSFLGGYCTQSAPLHNSTQFLHIYLLCVVCCFVCRVSVIRTYITSSPPMDNATMFLRVDKRAATVCGQSRNCTHDAFTIVPMWTPFEHIAQSQQPQQHTTTHACTHIAIERIIKEPPPSHKTYAI